MPILRIEFAESPAYVSSALNACQAFDILFLLYVIRKEIKKPPAGRVHIKTIWKLLPSRRPLNYVWLNLPGSFLSTDLKMDLRSLFHLSHSVVAPLDCMYGNGLYAVTVSCPSGAYRSIRLCLRFMILRTETVRQSAHSTLITPSAFLYPISLAPQFGQNQAKGTQDSLLSSTSHPRFHHLTLLLPDGLPFGFSNNPHRNGIPVS